MSWNETWIRQGKSYSMDSDAVINPIAAKNLPSLGPVAIMAATKQDVCALRSALGLQHKKSQNIFVANVWITETGLTLSGPFIGAPHAVMILENLIVRGVREIFFLGWCGSISETLSVGDLLLVDRAWSEEGVSPHYGLKTPGSPVTVDAGLLTGLGSAFTKSGKPWNKGDIWTTDALYRETHEKITSYKEKKVVAVDMETSALFSVARFRGVALASIQVVSDNLSSLTWQPGFASQSFRRQREAVVAILAQIANKRVS